jgi:two-component system nitrate/nitrite sensor histidine kinase NarX
MSKKSSSMKSSVQADFSWAKDSRITAANKDWCAETRAKIVPPAAPSGHFNQLLEELLGSLIEAVNANAGVVRLPSPHGPTLQLFSSVGLSAELLEAERAGVSDCDTCSRVLNIRGIYSADISACRSPQNCRYAACKIGSLATATIESHETPNHPIGKLTLFFKEHQDLSEHTSKTVLAFARILSAIIEHNKSNRDAKRADLIAERQAIANEVHDSLAQSLVYARMRTSLLLESLRKQNGRMATRYAQEIDDTLASSQKSVRELITDFRCAMDPSGLQHALQTLADQFRQRNDITLEYANLVASFELPLEYEIQVSHIVKEALANIASHSGATNAYLRVQYCGNYYVITIADNGSGGCTFTPVEGHYGMMIMRERAQRIGGEIKVESTTEFGTRVQLYFPEPGYDWRKSNE